MSAQHSGTAVTLKPDAAHEMTRNSAVKATRRVHPCAHKPVLWGTFCGIAVTVVGTVLTFVIAFMWALYETASASGDGRVHVAYSALWLMCGLTVILAVGVGISTGRAAAASAVPSPMDYPGARQSQVETASDANDET